MNLTQLATRLQQALGILQKRDIQPIAQQLGRWVSQAPTQAQAPILLGDDCAAIPDGDGYLLFAAEGIWPTLVQTDPWFAGWCSVLVNVSDIYAMGGYPLAVVDTLWTETVEQMEPLLQGMLKAAQVFNVPIVGGHTNGHSPYKALGVAILGRAERLISSFTAQPGDTLLLATNFDGRSHPDYNFWDAATQADPAQLRTNLALLPQLAAAGLCDTGKDVSMGGLIGTTIMLLETSGCGAVLDLEAIPVPEGLDLETWLLSFPSYGFLLSVRSQHVAHVQRYFQAQHLICAPIGQMTLGSQLTLTWQSQTCSIWDCQTTALTGFASKSGASEI
ncbi:MAG: sll0787 family AIR synthase-like protein [Cyanobacteria bacterium P01_H01_bin.121]